MYAVIKIPAEAGSTLNVFAIAGRMERSQLSAITTKPARPSNKTSF